MPDATEWLVEYADALGKPAYERALTFDDALAFIGVLVSQGRTAALYERVPYTITVHAPRKRRKTPPPADKPGSDTPTGPGNGEAGELKGAADPHAEGGRDAGSGVPSSAAPADPDLRTASNLASPVFPWTCEARFDGDPACPGPVERDRVTCGWFCALHALIPESNRRELHRRNHARNRPVRVAHAG